MFTRKTIRFLKDLQANNNRDWFQENKQRYEDEVRTPALAFVEAMEPALHKVSPYINASSKKVGGSLMRVYRDTRFSKDKTPYKTNIGIHFRHARARDVHAPGYYVHIEPGDIFFGAGIWQPDSPTLLAVRTLIDEHPKEWKTVKQKVCTRGGLELQGSSLKRAPKGFDPEHSLIDDLKRKDFIAITNLPQNAIIDKDFTKTVAKLVKTSAPLMKFICDANDLMF
ncbi:MAG: DUF2461 domain-containing protein [Granulosicoccus sp.]|nr:DUF2461 domain-containing protein [Granulosicoccus sp.]